MLKGFFKDFRKLKSLEDKITFIQNMKSLNLNFEINYDNLIKYYQSKQG